MRKRMLFIRGLCGCAALFLCCGTGWAITITFDPDSLIQSAPAGPDDPKVSQEDARRIHAAWGNPYYGTFSDPVQAGHTQPGDYNTYMNWRDSLGAGEGIACFNTWFLDDTIAPSWGETTVIKPGSTVTATAAPGWNIEYIVNPYGLGGTVVQFYTLDSANYINNASQIPNFTVTADLYYDANANGWDATDTPVNGSIRMWVGNLNGDDPGFYRSDTQALYFDNLGWGERPGAAAPFSATYSTGANQPLGSGFEAAITGTPVPEPASMAILGMGILGVVATRMRKRNAV